MVFAFGVGVIVQKDLGSSLILAAICFICFMSTPRDYYKKYKKLVWIALAVAVIILGFLITAVLQGYQLQRIDSWLKPLKIENIYDSSWQLVNSLIAFTDGGVFGLGLGNSIQKYDYIPEAHNDFIGAIIYEELGIFGLALMIIPTAIIIFRLLKYADQIQNNKSRVILIGIASYFMLHLFVNLGGRFRIDSNDRCSIIISIIWGIFNDCCFNSNRYCPSNYFQVQQRTTRKNRHTIINVSYDILGDLMDNLKEFKAFLKTIPSIKEDVLNHRYTWQEIYEIYTMYGEDDHFFKPYKEHPIENMNVLEIIKNVDLEALSSSLQSIEKVLGIVSNLLDKNKEGK